MQDTPRPAARCEEKERNGTKSKPRQHERIHASIREQRPSRRAKQPNGCENHARCSRSVLGHRCPIQVRPVQIPGTTVVAVSSVCKSGNEFCRTDGNDYKYSQAWVTRLDRANTRAPLAGGRFAGWLVACCSTQQSPNSDTVLRERTICSPDACTVEFLERFVGARQVAISKRYTVRTFPNRLAYRSKIPLPVRVCDMITIFTILGSKLIL